MSAFAYGERHICVVLKSTQSVSHQQILSKLSISPMKKFEDMSCSRKRHMCDVDRRNAVFGENLLWVLPCPPQNDIPSLIINCSIESD